MAGVKEVLIINTIYKLYSKIMRKTLFSLIAILVVAMTSSCRKDGSLKYTLLEDSGAESLAVADSVQLFKVTPSAAT